MEGQTGRVQPDERRKTLTGKEWIMMEDYCLPDYVDGRSAPMVSVIVVTYNHEKYIAKALDSILKQKTKFLFEILVGDDASTDSTTQIVLDYQKKYPSIVRVVLHDKNVGAARNSYDTMKLSRGKYLASCEGDDFWTD